MTAAVGPLPHFCPTPVSRVTDIWVCDCGRRWLGVDFGSCPGWLLIDPAGQPALHLLHEPVPDSLARLAYHAYGQVTGGYNHRGEPMPAYDELPDTTQQAWRAAACAARTAGRAQF